MQSIRAFALFCDSVRDEVGGTQSIIGIFPDNIEIGHVPVGLPKLSVYVRVLVDVDVLNPGPLSIWIVFPNGEERELHTHDRQLVVNSLADAKTLGAPFTGFISHATMPQFPIMQFGRVRVVLRTEAEEFVCGTLNFKERPSSSIGPVPHPAAAAKET
jgi:hypothetical protein